MSVSPILFSHASDEWGTPLDLFGRLDMEFHFTLDPCATKENALCPEYFTKEQDGLKQDWSKHRAFMNPPYSQIPAWIEKASKAGGLVVCLLPARTDTRWFHSFAPQAELRFIKGRLKFKSDSAVGAKNCAPFPSLLLIFPGRPLLRLREHHFYTQ